MVCLNKFRWFVKTGMQCEMIEVRFFPKRVYLISSHVKINWKVFIHSTYGYPQPASVFNLTRVTGNLSAEAYASC
jgi:hypothetical protein